MMKKILFILIVCFNFAHASIFSSAIKAYQNKDYKKAYALFQRSLDNQSSIQANYFLGLMQLRGLGVDKNIPMAKRHLKAAADIGNARAKCLLAEVYIYEAKINKANEILRNARFENIIECQQIKQEYNLKLKGE